MSREKKPGTKGGTGKFMPCPANPFAHTEGVGPVGIEVKWSCKKTPRGIKTSFYFGCGLCKAQLFLNTWNDTWGWTLPQAESMGMTLIGLDSTRKNELLKELGLERMPPGFPPQPPGFPPGFQPPGPPGPPRPRRGPPKKPKN